MDFKRLFPVFLIGVLFIGGCIFGDDDSGDDIKDKITSINELTMGGGVFIFKEQGFGLAQIATFFGKVPYEDATVYINGVQLSNNMGIHTNIEQLSVDTLTSGPTLKIAVYALGDSVVHNLTIPENPVIEKPGEGAVVTAGDSLYMEIAYPGAHQYIAMSLIGPEDVAFGTVTSSTLLKITIEGEKLPNVGTFPLNAYSVNTSDIIPESGFNINNQYELFLVAAVAVRNIEFVKAD
ncbi:hypothetical protein ES703_60204 [subsurface metagenome]